MISSVGLHAEELLHSLLLTPKIQGASALAICRMCLQNIFNLCFEQEEVAMIIAVECNPMKRALGKH